MPGPPQSQAPTYYANRSYGVQGYYGDQGYYSSQGYYVAQGPYLAPAWTAPLSPWAVTGFVLALVGFSIPGLVVSIVGIVKTSDARVASGRGLAIAGTVIGAVGTALFVVVILPFLLTGAAVFAAFASFLGLAASTG